MAQGTAPIKLIVGLGNPGPEYAETRHNAGAWFVDQVARKFDGFFRSESKLGGDLCKVSIAGKDVYLLLPDTYMNESGQAVLKLAHYYKILPQQILVAHDELDLPVGDVRLKSGGGHGGHNGLRDIFKHLHSQDFLRLRVGIDHPGNKNQVTNYVLKRPSSDDRISIDRGIDRGMAVLPDVVKGEVQSAMKVLHS